MSATCRLLTSKSFIIAVFLMWNAFAFSQIKIKGQLKDQNDKPIEFAEAVLMKIDSVATTNSLTDEKGIFLIETEKGEYILTIRHNKEIVYSKNLSLSDDLDIGTVRVEKISNLQEVVVNSKKKLIERQVDRLVFNVENSVSVSGGDAVDALKVTPGLRVQNDQISMIGKSGMAVMINDRLLRLSGNDLINYLKSIRADDIKSIEVITNPPARYSAEGNSGIVNIKLKKARPNSWSATANGVYSQATYPTGTAGGTFNYQKEKLTFSAGSNYTKGSIQNVFTTKTFFPKEVWDNKIYVRNFTNLLSNNLSIDYQNTKNVSVGAQYVGSHDRPDMMDNNTSYVSNNESGLNNGVVLTNGYNNKKTDINSFNGHSIIKLDTIGRTINVDLDYLKFKSNDDRDFSSATTNSDGSQIQNGYLSANNGTVQKIDNFSAQINIDHPLKWANLNYGTKVSFSTTNNVISYFNTTTGTPVFDPSQSDIFKYRENIQALYISGNKKFWHDKWQVQAGLRFESTQTEGNSISYDQKNTYNYAKFFPTVYFTYTHTENHNFSLNYGRRISRPGFQQLNPFKWYFSPYSYVEGNPYLRPSYSNNFELNHTYKGALVTGLFYSQSIDASGQVQQLNPDTYQQIFTQLNYNNTYQTGLSETFVFNKLKWLESQSGLYLYYTHADSKIYPVTPKTFDGMGLAFSTSNTFTLNKNKTSFAGFDFSYNSPTNTQEFYYLHALTQINVYARMLFLNKNLQVSVVGNNLLKTYPKIEGIRNDTETRITAYNDTRSVRLSVTYKFGNSKISENKRSGSNEDVKSRIN